MTCVVTSISELDEQNVMERTTTEQKRHCFIEHLKKYGIVGWSGSRITTKYNKKGELKKDLSVMGRWEHINKSNMYNNIKYKDESYFIRTGKEFGILGLDFDTVAAYTDFIKHNDECKAY